MIGTRREDGSSIGTAWMVTFSDLVVLMLAFFVLLFSMSAFKLEAFERLTQSLSATFSPSTTIAREPEAGEPGVLGIMRPRGQSLGYLAGVLDSVFDRDERFAGTLVQRLDDRLVVLLPADLLFEPGGAAIAAEARPVVTELGSLLANLRNRIALSGHADPRPVAPGNPYPDNWALSLARAAAVANGLRRAGFARPLEVWGHADTRFAALDSVPEAERTRLARRVDLVILPDRAEDELP
ncbi:flagellar motor protein MotB [Roseospira marina]|uniref:Flagellar motor protein MotB n=1 Tax=Roseospira marina TaxID=140057 RepID=A0A5M6IDB8_9PROT|nr:flagellar motor protein MotB [Roseospira marina]KAA5606062.1 flagellar motor protein MotB [Roseospira marina]MBB4313074.1 chemotaxis protein MotB [Roseospira marina]MBB5086185.1 chemotaxis protein MotB [Roseospira marina]